MKIIFEEIILFRVPEIHETAEQNIHVIGVSYNFLHLNPNSRNLAFETS